MNSRMTMINLVMMHVCLANWCMAGEPGEAQFQLVADDVGQVLKTPDGRTMFRYMTKKPQPTVLTANSVCCLYPVLTPKGVEAVEFAAEDHPHHRGIFLAWHATTCAGQGADFWGWGEFAPTENRMIRNVDIRLVEASDKAARVKVRNDWVIGDKNVMKEILTIDAQETDGVFVIDLHFLFKAKVDVSLDETAFGGFCVKGTKGDVTYTAPKGAVDLPDPHHLKPPTNWPGADWYDYSVALKDDTTLGVSVVDHPANPKTTWHNLEPIHMVNPCIVAPGAVPIAKGDALNLRYRVVVHDGPAPIEVLETLAKDFRK